MTLPVHPARLLGRTWPVLLVCSLVIGCGPVQLGGVPSPTALPTTTPIIIVVVVTATPAPTTPTPAETATPALASATRTATAAPATSAAASLVATPQTSFRLCGGADPAAEQAIARLIGGRPFRATLTGQSNGCANLDITVQPNSGAITGRQSTSLTVDSLNVQIVSENGTTQVQVTRT